MDLQDRRPAYPIRRMIAVAVMFAGLIGPLLVSPLLLADRGGLGCLAGPFLLLPAGGLLCLLLALRRGSLAAWRASLVLFVTGLLAGGLITAGGAISGGPDTLRIGAATLAYFGCGLAAVCSLNGRWLLQREWTPAVDPLAGANKAAILHALHARRRGS